MEVQLSNFQKALIRSIAEKEGFVELVLRTSPGSSKGDNYLGVITRVTIAKERKTLKLIMKSAMKSKELRRQFPIRELYLREAYVYETIFHEFDKFQKEERVTNGFVGHAKMYGSCKRELNEFLCFEDLKEVGYGLWNRRIPMDASHIELVFREYGKLHAMSLAMKDKRPELYGKITENMSNPFVDFPMPNKEETELALMRSILSNGIKAVEGNHFATEALNKLCSVAQGYFFEDIRLSEDHIVIIHGDCWCNNMLFKYENAGNNEPTKVCLIDWQQSMVGSPAMDLTHFFFSSAPKDILYDYQRYLRIYHHTVCDVLRQFRCDSETLFPFVQLEGHWRKYVKYGLYQSLIIVKLMVSDNDEVPDITEIADSGKDFMEEIQFDSMNNETYKERIIDMVTFAAENDWI